ncbi:phosphoenolpyruvate carboxykinase (ATP) [Aestuariivirga litoralis]|uniref:Phosphoenolpyruvate carboxykinase (ATP) n=1 Tax=Aestuariivirga litoralis TaxID=2650924 RepID=A0A2W2BSR6_9HYPH|nr:phosphoenolpyruvate carboxykinase [Aestuariivirga litoralis]PZF76486.1 phosphoenolpyruvate carboxykinase (ATP) [Aestuariivirga litoralis]
MDTAADALIRAQLADLGLAWLDKISWNAPAAVLYQDAISRGEGLVAEGGGLVVTTGQHTGRSPNDKFVVRDATTENTIWWDNNKAMSREQFETLRKDFMAHARLKNVFVQDLAGGAEMAYQLPTRVITEYAWHALFIQHLLIVPEDQTGFAPKLTIIDLPSFKADPARHGTRSETVIALDLANGLVLIGGTQYAGEMKKSVFTVLNYLLPEKGVMPMHCSANVGHKGDSAVFFGLSGTGKTTLSADPSRTLVGDDEHGWSENGLFNFEGGCYAKVIKLSKEAEPQIHATTEMWGTVLENVKIDPATRKLDLHDGSLTENTRSAYPLSAIPNASRTGTAPIPKTIVMLTADAFGVLPPIAKLTPAQAMYHFLSGYTAKVAGTERGVTEPQATFSTCFGAPFIPRDPGVYGELLRDLIAKHDVSCWLVNTGWTGGAYGEGHRMPIKATRALLNAALEGRLDNVPMRTDANFGFAVPEAVEGVDTKILTPRETWADRHAYDAMARKLVGMFVKNFARFEAKVGADVKAASPTVQLAAE